MEEAVIRKALPVGWQLRARVLRTRRERLVGLLGTSEGDWAARPVILVGCDSIHTFGMRYGIDVALLDGVGTVLSSVRSLPPGRVRSSRHAEFVLERPRSPGPWPEEGERVWLAGPDGVTNVVSTLRKGRTWMG